MIPIIRPRLIQAMLLSIFVFAITMTMTMAWFQQSIERGIIIETGEFEVELLVYFDGVLMDINSPYYDRENSTLVVNAFDAESENYIGNLEIKIAVTPEVAARMRIRLHQEWTIVRSYIDQNPEDPVPPVNEAVYHEMKGAGYYPFSLFKTGLGFAAIHDVNGYAYMPNIIPKNQTTMINLIDGGDPYPVRSNPVFFEECYVYVTFFVDLVQANRFVEIWAIAPDYFD